MFWARNNPGAGLNPPRAVFAGTDGMRGKGRSYK